MIVIYIAGPFRASSAWGVEQNVRRAEEVAYQVWAAGYVAVCPHTNTRFFDQSLPDQIFIDGTLEMMRRCDAVLVLPGHERSQGTLGEIREAARLNMPMACLKTLESGNVSISLRQINEMILARRQTQRKEA